ncbi:MAG: shikimate dehydrogenase [Myxococcota bacterium]
MTARYCLLGHPIEHSLSPRMHNAGFEALGLDARYELKPTPLEHVDRALVELRAGTMTGCNATTPLKGAVAGAFPGSERVKRSGSANTVYRDGETLRVESTDVDGVREPLQARGVNGGEAIVLGAGGAARAAALALEELGFTVHVAARAPEKAALLLEEVAPRPRGRALHIEALGRDKALLRTARVLIQATPLGRCGETLPIPWDLIENSAVAFEMLYVTTPFLNEAARRGLKTIPGWEMLLEQGLRSFELWTGQPAPRDAMRDALRG